MRTSTTCGIISLACRIANMKQTKEHLEKRLVKHRQAMLLRKEASLNDGSSSICSSCGKSVDVAEFNKDARYIHGYRKRCKKCSAKQSRKATIKKTFGLSESQYTRKINDAKGCESCGSINRLVLDHCHKTGRVRGVLCSNCNTALGLLRDSPKNIGDLLMYSLSYS